jgi:serine/threonine protein kinase
VGRTTVQESSELTRLGSYEIVRKLARGGMAELFLARTVGPEGFAKLVVLKKILPQYAENPKFVRLFLDEARLVAGMEHPHIAHVYDMGKADNDYFFTMEYVHGQDVRTTWRRTTRAQRAFPVQQAVLITRAIASALHYAHERTGDDGALLGVVHRDVSPSNILLSYDGAVKLVDFGVAKAATSSVKTRTGTLKGKISYMSPEQAKGGTIDRRSDVFSLGIVLWELLTGKRLYKADNDLATIQMIINVKPQPPSQLRPDSPPALDAIVARALASDAAARYQTAEELQLDLEALARSQRWGQTDATLRVFMHELFDDEIRAWMNAHASGQTLIDHVLAAQPTLLLNPLSESELSDGEDEELDDDDLDDPADDSAVDSLMPTEGPATLTSLPPAEGPATLLSLPPAEALATEKLRALPDERPTEELAAQTTVQPPPVMPTTQIAVPPPPLHAHPRLPTPVPGVVRAATHGGPLTPVPRSVDPLAFGYAPAPAAWRPQTAAAGVATTGAAREQQQRRILIAASIFIAVIVLLIAALAGRDVRPEAGAAHKVQMRTMPAADDSRPGK